MAPCACTTDDNMWNKFGCVPPSIPAFSPGFQGAPLLRHYLYQVNRIQVTDKTIYTVQKKKKPFWTPDSQ